MTGNAELAEIRKELREMRWYVDDADLREAVSEWIEESHDKSDADTAREYVEQALNGQLAEHEMYHAPQLSRGEDGFPDACEGCRHYGSACPVLLDDTEVRWRERELEEAASETEARRVYQQQAIDVSCHRIPELLEEWDTRHSEFIQRGQQLLSNVEKHMRDEDSVTSSTSSETALPDGGTS
jgi:hypothetical protein